MSTIQDEDPAATLETLPIELKELIFEYLPSADLLSLTRTSKTLHSAVEGNKKYVKNLVVHASKLIQAQCVSYRHYTRLIVDVELTESILEIIKNSFINIGHSVKEIQIVYSDHDKLASELLDICTSFETVGMIFWFRVKDKDFPLRVIDNPPFKTLCFWEFKNLNIHPKFPQVQQVNLYNGDQMSGGDMLRAYSNIKRLNIFDSALLDCEDEHEALFDTIPNLEELIFQDCRMMLHAKFKHLKLLKFINCTLEYCGDHLVLDQLLPEPCTIDELHIERCDTDCFWLEERIHEGNRKIGHMKLVNMKLPRKYIKMIEDIRSKVDKLTMINITFE